jgi:hypothetical protein
MADSAIVVQNFNKPDTLEAVCKSLLECANTNQYDLIFWSDSASGARKETEYSAKCAEVGNLLDSFFTSSRDRFRSITLRRNPSNLGCYKTCQIALDYAFNDHEFVIFSEDDTIFSSDALDWFTAVRSLPAFSDDAVWGIAGESIFFDARRAPLNRGLVEGAKVHAAKHHLWEQFIPLDFIPSTCFATNRRKWAEFAVTRGKVNGDVELCYRCQAERKKCLFPVIARVKDVGMLHPDGYSVSIHTEENVTGVKNCYLMSGDIKVATDLMSALRPFDGDVGLLFWRSTDLNGFDEDSPNPAAGEPVSIAQQAALLRDARQAGLKGDWPLALRLWQDLEKGALLAQEVDTNIGLCLLKLGQREEAEEVVQHVLALHPDDWYAQSIMAYILEANKDFRGAAKIWTELSQRTGLPEWLTVSAVNGELRCQPAGTASRS